MTRRSPPTWSSRPSNITSSSWSWPSEVDEAATEAYLEGKAPTEAELKALIRKGTINSLFVPILCGSAFKNKGVQPMLDAVVDYLPSPLDVPPVKGIDVKTGEEVTRAPKDDAPLSMLAFKIMNDPFVGSLTFCRIYSGKVESGTTLINTVKDKKERIGRMLLMHANHREDIKEAYTGDIVALAGLKDVTTGDTLCDPTKPVILERMEFPDPVIEVAVEPKTKGDQEKLGVALHRLAQEDPSFRVSVDHESGQTIIKGMGELHLDIIVDRMRREFKVEANVGAPQVAFRETVSKRADVDYTHKKQTGGSGQFARVKMTIEPNEAGKGFEFENKVVGGNVPKEYIPGVAKGVQSVVESGVLAGFPMLDVKVTLTDGAYHDVDSSRHGVRDRRPRRLPRRRAQGGTEAARADHEGRGGDAGGLCRRHHRRSHQPQRSGARPGDARQRLGDQRHGAARQYVRLCEQPALDEPGPGAVHHAVRSLRAGAAGRRRGGEGEVRLSSAAGRPRGNEFDLVLKDGEPTWLRKNSSGRSRIATSGPSVMSITARRR